MLQISTPEANSAAIQSAVDAGEIVVLPSGRIELATPIVYHQSLVLRGACGARYRPQSSVIQANFAGPIFRKRDTHFNWQDWTLTTNNLQCTVDVDGVVIENIHQYGVGLEIHHARCPSRVVNSTFQCRFQGLSVFGSFNTLVQNCGFYGGYFRHWSWLNKQMAEVAWGVMLNGHGTIAACDVTGWGTGVKLTGIQCAVESLRVEINGYGMHIGGRAPSRGTQTEPLQRSKVSTISLEANCHNMLVASLLRATTISCVEGQGSTNAPSGLTEKGLEVLHCGDTCKIESVGMFGNFRDYAIKMHDTRNAKRVTGHVGTEKSLFLDTKHQRRKHLLSGVAIAAKDATEVSVLFPLFPDNRTANFALSTEGEAIAESASAEYGVAIQNDGGQTNVAGRMRQQIDVHPGQSVVLNFWSPAPPPGHRRKIYKFASDGQVLGFWYFDNGLRFVDSGQPFDGRDFPSERHLKPQLFTQPDGYTVETEPCGVAVEVENKTSEGFSLVFAEPLQTDKQISWSAFLVESL